MLRRQLLHFGAFTLGGLPVSLVRAQGGPQKKLVVVMLRGAVDGLSVVAPYAEPEYAANRPQIALPPPGADGGLLKLDAMFGLHPSLAPFERQFKDFANAIQSGGRPLVSGEDGYQALAVVDAVYRSCRTGQPVRP